MGSTELAANLFRATQTEEKLRRGNIRGKQRANQTHYEVGAKVRQTIEDLGRPGRILLSAGIPDLPIEMASARLLHKSNQENHPFDLTEVRDLVTAIQAPLAVFRSATRLDSKVIMTELQHAGEKWCAKSNFVVAVRINKIQGKIRINSVRSVHYRSSNMHIINWINEDLADYIAPDFEVKWLDDIKKEFRSKPQYNSADVRTKLLMVAKIVQAADKSK